jgi:hypothetical protein
MASSTGPILATGGITFVNKWIGNNQGADFKILVATGIAAAGFFALEKVSPELATGIAWIALVTSLLIQPKAGNSAVNNALRLTGLGKNQ